ncbi:MAG TPA: Hpt domain-containing protein, partial [Patescibacteria group bacterium]
MVDISKFKEIFVSEAEDLLMNLNKDLLALEKKGAQKNLLNNLMRSFHTLKSSAAAMGYKQISSLAHSLEDIFDQTRKTGAKLGQVVISRSFQAVDALEKSLGEIKKSGQEADLSSVIAGVQKISSQSSKKKAGFTPAVKSAATVTESQTVEAISHVKVPVQRLDQLLASVEELLIDKLKLERLVKFEKVNQLELRDITAHLSRLVSDIQYQVM